MRSKWIVTASCLASFLWIDGARAGSDSDSDNDESGRACPRRGPVADLCARVASLERRVAELSACCDRGGNGCPAGETPVCCPAGDVFCPTVGCVDLEDDGDNCGACGRACDADLSCVDGACVLTCGGNADCAPRGDRCSPAGRCGCGPGPLCASGEVCRNGDCIS